MAHCHDVALRLWVYAQTQGCVNRRQADEHLSATLPDTPCGWRAGAAVRGIRAV
jgi:hypothetical protein